MILSETIAVRHLMGDGNALGTMTNRNGRVLVHLLHDGSSECGTLFGTPLASVMLFRAIAMNTWCYSCLGNALQEQEKLARTTKEESP